MSETYFYGIYSSDLQDIANSSAAIPEEFLFEPLCLRLNRDHLVTIDSILVYLFSGKPHIPS